MDFFNELQDFFAGLTRPETLYLLIIGVTIFLLAFLLGLLLRGRSLNRYKKQVMMAEKERADYEARYLSAVEKEKALSREVEQLSREKVAALEALEKRPEIVEVAENNGVANSELQDQIQQLQLEVSLLREENESLKLQSSNVSNQTANPATNLPGGEAQPFVGTPQDTGGDGVSTNDQLQAYLEATESRFFALEAKLTELDGENARLEHELGNLKNQETTTPGDRKFNQPHQPVVGRPATDDDGEPLVIRADITNPGVRTDDNGGMEVIVDASTSIQVPIVAPEDDTVDNLQAIKNIGPFNEKKLNEAGIFSYRQIAEWSDEDIDDITLKIGYVPGLIKKSEWVKQARMLVGDKLDQAAAKPTQSSTTSSKPTKQVKTRKSTSANNLKVVEGIGPKIESILKAGGVEDLSGLANSSPDSLRSILVNAGNRFKAHNPDTWPTQAALAKNEQWTELKILQDKLKGGKV